MMIKTKDDLIKEILKETITAEFYSKIVARIKSRHNRVFLTPANSATETINNNDIAVLELIFAFLNAQSIKSLTLKASSLNADFQWPKDISSEDALYWVRKPRWSLPQAALLSVGICPYKDCEELLMNSLDIVNIHRHPVVPEVVSVLNNLIEHDEYNSFENYSPLEFVQWFSDYEYIIPEILHEEAISLGKKSYNQPKPKKISEKTLLKIIAGMSVGAYNFDPNSLRSNVTKSIQSDLENSGIHLDKKTILNCLRSASKFIEPERFQE